MSTRNALPLIKQALTEKIVEVFLPDRNNPIRGYLVKISGDLDFVQDFHLMYGDMDAGILKMTEERLCREDPACLKNHGVLIDPETMGIIFTFNMAFADLYRKSNWFVRFPIMEIFPIEIPGKGGKAFRDDEPCFGLRAQKLVEKYKNLPSGKVANCRATFEDALKKHEVSVRLPGEVVRQKLYLIKIWAKTDLGEDYRISYPETSTFPKRDRDTVAYQAYHEYHEYGLFIVPDDLTLVFAFNTGFAHYDSQSKTVKYREMVKEQHEKFEPSEIVSAMHKIAPAENWDRGVGMHGVIMYALSEPRK